MHQNSHGSEAHGVSLLIYSSFARNKCSRRLYNRTKTVWQTHTAPTSTCLIQSTKTVYTRTVPSSTVVKTSTQVVTKTSTATATVTASSQVTEVFKRAVGEGKPQPPKCMLNKCFAYTPDRITAACRCINVPPKTVTATHTACSSTKTVVCLFSGHFLLSSVEANDTGCLDIYFDDNA